MGYDRYTKFRGDGDVSIVPFIKIPERKTDYYITYNKLQHRLDVLSYECYGDPDYGWLILQANPQYGSLEFEIPDNVDLRIPYPLGDVIEGYNRSVAEYKAQYGK